MGLKAQTPQVLHYKWTLVERRRDRGAGAKREEGDAKLPNKSSPDSQEKRYLNHDTTKRERALKPKGPFNKGMEKRHIMGQGCRVILFKGIRDRIECVRGEFQLRKYTKKGIRRWED